MSGPREFDDDVHDVLSAVQQHPPVPPDLVERLLAGLAPTSDSRGGTATKRRPSGRRWWALPVLAAMVVAVIAIGIPTLLIAIRSTDTGRPAGTSTFPAPGSSHPAPPSGATSSPTLQTTTPAAPRPSGGAGGIWGAVPVPVPSKQLGQLQLGRADLLGSDDALYVAASGSFAASHQNSILRIDPVSGAVTARAAQVGAADPDLMPVPVVLSSDAVWSAGAPDSNGKVQLRKLDLVTLRVSATIDVPFGGVLPGGLGTVLAAAPNGGRLYLGAGTSIAEIDPTTGHTVGRIPVDGGQVRAVAVSPDNSRLYVAVSQPGDYSDVDGNSILQARSITDGSVIAVRGGAPHLGAGNVNFGAIQQLVATGGGVWITGFCCSRSNQSGMFMPADLTTNGKYEPTLSGGAGGPFASVSLDHGATWTGGGTGGTGCADPDTGQIRARVQHGIRTSLSHITFVKSTAFALYATTASINLVRINPPPECLP